MTDTAYLHRKEFEIDEGERIIIAEAPGRLHFLGDHGETDHGIFLTCGVDRTIRVAASPRKDTSLRFFSAEMQERKRSSLANLRFKREDRWANYCKTALYIFASLGCPIKGMNFTISGDVPRNISLASSSAIELASALVMRRIFMPSMSDKDLLNHLVAAHADFFNGKNQIIDYLAMMNAKKDHFLIIDEETLNIVKIKNPFSKNKILIFDSRVPLIDVDHELMLRAKDLKTGVKVLSGKKKGKSLKDFSQDDLDELMGSLNEDVRRRCLFVMQERELIKTATEALLTEDKEMFAKSLYHSHEGLRDLFEVSCPETDWLVKRAAEQSGVLGSRMTGKGFGGCVYIIIQNNSIEEYEKRMDDYERIFGFRPVVYEVKPAGNAKMISK